MTFEEWMNEVEVYSTRKERLIEGLVTYRDDHEFVIKWLEAAYNVGYKAGVEAAHAPIFPNHSANPPPYVPPKNCSRCGISLCRVSLAGAMRYVCNDQLCPTFARVTCVTTGPTSAVNLGTKSTEGYNG